MYWLGEMTQKDTLAQFMGPKYVETLLTRYS
jgi:hypothetical protein